MTSRLDIFLCKRFLFGSIACVPVRPLSREWWETGYSASEAQEWANAGYTPSDATQLRMAGITLDEAWEYPACHDVPDVCEWHRLGFDGAEARRWGLSRMGAPSVHRRRFLEPAEAAYWRKSGVDPATAHAMTRAFEVHNERTK